MPRRGRAPRLPDTRRRKRKSGTHPEAHLDPTSADRSQPLIDSKKNPASLDATASLVHQQYENPFRKLIQS